MDDETEPQGFMGALGKMEVALADRLATFWRGLAMFFAGALLSGAVIFFKDYAPRADVEKMIEAKSILSSKDMDRERDERIALNLRVQTLESQMGAIAGKLDTIVTLLGKDPK